MKLILSIIILFLIQSLCLTQSIQKEFPKGIIYVHPKAGTCNYSPSTSIILKLDRITIELNAGAFDFSVKNPDGEEYIGRTIVSGNSVIFKPDGNFDSNELIKVTFTYKLSNREINYNFEFRTGTKTVFDDAECDYDVIHERAEKTLKSNLQSVAVINGVSVPSDFPQLIFSEQSPGAAPGKIFINNRYGSSYLAVYKQDGTPYFYKKVDNGSRDFRVQSNGILTYLVRTNGWKYLGMNNQLEVVDTFKAANGYMTDDHELNILPDGHYFLIARSSRNYPFIDTTGSDTTMLILSENNVQEFDKEHNLVFEWMSQNHFKFEDAVNVRLSGKKIDYIHMNSIAVDFDSNIVISSRHLCEVTKIDRQTGDIIWRLGGKNNQFSFVNETYEFSYQHDAQPVPGKPNHYTLFDNGNYRAPYFSRVVEYVIDTSSMTATKVWEQWHNPAYFTSFMGNAQRLPNGNTLINWAVSKYPKLEEYTKDHELVLSADFENPNYSYRTYKYEWESVAERPYLIFEIFASKVNLIFNKFGDSTVKQYFIYSGLSPNNMELIDSTTNPYFELTEFPERGNYFFKVRAQDFSGVLSKNSNLVEVPVDFISAGGNLIKNSTFTLGNLHWELRTDSSSAAIDTISADSNFWIKIVSGGNDYSSVQLIQNGIPLISGKEYKLHLEAFSSGTKIIEINLERATYPYTDYSKLGYQYLGSKLKEYNFKFKMNSPTDTEANLIFNIGGSDHDVFIKSVSLNEVVSTGIKKFSTKRAVTLFRNYPNPFNPETNIVFSLASKSYVEIEIFNLIGERIASLFSGELPSGIHSLEWTGNSDAKQPVGSGVYLCRLQAGSSSKTIKLVVLR